MVHAVNIGSLSEQRRWIQPVLRESSPALAVHDAESGEGTYPMRTTRRASLAAGVAVALLLAACGGDGDTTADDTETDTEVTDDTDDADDGDQEEAAPEDVEGPDVTLNLGHPFPAGHLIQANVLEDWAQEVNEVTNGTVTVEFHPGAALAAPDATYENAAAGAMELGWALHGYTPGRFPLTDVVELPFQFENATQATEVLWDLYEEFDELQQEYQDVHVLGLWTHDIGNLYTVDQQVNEPGDVAGLTLRAPGPLQNSLVEEFGGSGVGLPAGELYDSLERGVIDGLMIADTGVQSFTLYEVVQYGIHANFYVAGQFLVMNQGAWDGLSESQQQAIESISGRELSMRAAEVYDEDHASVLEMYDEWGMDVQLVDDVDVDEWRDASQPVVDSWIEQREGEGQPGQAMFDRMQELVGN
jgi:TRAP-type transport system periplasmic protein